MFWVVVTSWASDSQPPWIRLPPRADSLFTAGTQQILSTEYILALATARTLEGTHPTAGCVLGAMVLLARFDDLGDTTIPAHAVQRLDQCANTKGEPFWEGLRQFQLGYAHTLLGNTLAGARRTRAGARDLRNMDNTDARAFYAIYGYYMDQLTAGLSWIPFVRDDRSQFLQTLSNGAAGSPYFRTLFATSLIWMHYDRGEFQAALDLVMGLRASAPQHPVFAQIQADMLFRMGQGQEALKIYQASAVDYARRAPGSLRWWCAALNLIRIHKALGQDAQAREWQQRTESPEFQALRKWLPASLLREL